MATAYVAAHADRDLAATDMRRRIKAIFIGSVGNLVEWVRLLCVRRLRPVFRRFVLSRH